ncbi:MAG: DinB family protein [Ignavibacteriaceae bacterium]|jgi:uncharacterized damage-inducible protein DinB
MRRFSIIISVLFLCSLMIGNISARDINKSSGNSASLIAQLVADDLQGTAKKVIALAEAVPADDYNWRPEKGVRSVSEVYVHIAMTNYFLLSYLGAKMPKDFDKNAEKDMKDKKDIINFLKQSFDDAQKFLSGYSDTDYDKVIELPFGKFSKKQLLMLVATHAHEHLGQSIAYARTNHIVPPWSK